MRETGWGEVPTLDCPDVQAKVREGRNKVDTQEVHIDIIRL